MASQLNTIMDMTLNSVSDPNKYDLDVDLNGQWTEGQDAFLTVRNVSDNWIFLKIKGNAEAVKATVIKPVKTVLRPKSKEGILFRLSKTAKRNLKQGDNAFMFLVKFNSFDLDSDRGSFKNLKYNLRFCMIVRNDFAYKTPALRNIKDQINAIMVKFQPFNESSVGFEDKFQDALEDNLNVNRGHLVKLAMVILFFYLFYYFGYNWIGLLVQILDLAKF